MHFSVCALTMWDVVIDVARKKCDATLPAIAKLYQVSLRPHQPLDARRADLAEWFTVPRIGNALPL